MFINKLFPEVPYTTSELTEIATHINAPAVQKYLKQMAGIQVSAIVHGVAKDGESAESYLRRQAVVQGQLAAIETLLEIEAPAKQA